MNVDILDVFFSLLMYISEYSEIQAVWIMGLANRGRNGEDYWKLYLPIDSMMDPE